MTDPAPAPTIRSRRAIPGWAWFALLALILFDVWWRAHTFAPTLIDRYGDLRHLWPVSEGRTEPLDCDEALYGTIGRVVRDGGVLYRDAVENKPPLGYWSYALAVSLGEADEITIRVMPIPIVLTTILLIWWIGWRLGGALAGCLAGLLFALLSSDPYIHGNGANLEHLQNLFAVASLAALIAGWPAGRRARLWFAIAGLLLGAASLVKQVEATHGLVYAGALWFRRDAGGERLSIPARLGDLLALAAGFLGAWVVAVAVLIAQGAGAAAFECIVAFGQATAAEIAAPPKAPPFLLRWIVGNSNPNNGELPWPFGVTKYLVWWGAGAWPIWLAMLAGVAWLLGRSEAKGLYRVLGFWSLSVALQVALPGQFWQHYYLLLAPAAALAVAILSADALDRVRSGFRKRRAGAVIAWSLLTLLLLAALSKTTAIQVRDYLLLPAEQLSIRYKGGYQWMRNREIGEALKARADFWERTRLFVWGWQSPVYFYSELNSPTRHLFVNDLVRDQARSDPPHPLVGPWVEEILRDLDADPPQIIFTGYPPFPRLEALLEERYRRSRLVPEAPALWVIRDAWPEFDRYTRKLRRTFVAPSNPFEPPSPPPEFPTSPRPANF